MVLAESILFIKTDDTNHKNKTKQKKKKNTRIHCISLNTTHKYYFYVVGILGTVSKKVVEMVS